MNKKPDILIATAQLRSRAEARLRVRPGNDRSGTGVPKSATDPQRLFHELQVHQVELEMQNAELQMARDRVEPLLEKYTDLYDFAPVGYFSLDESGRILEVNLTGAALLGVERSRLINRILPRFVASESQPGFLAFLKRVFAGTGKQQVCEAAVLREDAPDFWAGFHGISAISVNGSQKWCRVAVSDITSIKQAEEAQRRMEILAVANRELKREIVRRQAVEKSLKKSEQHQSRLLEQSHQMHEQLRQLSRQILSAQEEERKRISRELHDVIAQTLTGINVRLAALKKEAALNTRGLDRNITRTQRLVEKSVDIVHEFARELRPAVLDDLGLIPALHSFMKNFTVRTGVRTHLTAFAGVEQLDTARRTVFFRVVQEALTNVARHAQASRVDVSIQKLPDCICMKIKDDGRSFHVERVLNAKGKKRLGLLGMRERLEMVGGRFDVESAPGKGTTIIAQFRSAKPVRKALIKSAKNKLESL
ncbi:MAG: PAS domain-containing sensor histidine kinase [Verrucomicrobiales bacterium]|nr:PAS domain-containing sensor histidine kinase [Verrucomicrobiales bacterium]